TYQERLFFPREKSPWVPELSTYFLHERAGTGRRGVSLGPHLPHVTREGSESKEQRARRRRGPTLRARGPAPPPPPPKSARSRSGSALQLGTWRGRAASGVGGAGQGWYIQSDRGRAPPVPAEGRAEPGWRRQEPPPGASRGPLTLWPSGAAERQQSRSRPPARPAAPRRPSRLSHARPAPPAAMNHSPLKTALAYECFPDQDNSTLALPSDQKMKTGTSGRQRVQEQVMMTVKRQKSKSSQSSTLSHSNRGSMYDGLADNYNNYGTTSRSSYYSKFQAGNGSWGYPRETEHERGKVRERGRHRIRNRLQALSCQHRARRGARTHGPRDHDLSRSWTPNRLSHSGTPVFFFNR
uniref:Uncharacterized protein n=1 Tax=Felis catus TaxID=9685 RepID=A0ABI7W7A4_FELCA